MSNTLAVISNKLEVMMKYYHDISNLGIRLYKTTKALVSFDLGEVFKIWFCDKNFKDLKKIDQSVIYTQYLETVLSKIAATGKYQDKHISHSQWINCFETINNYDDFLHTKLKKLIGIKNKNIIDSILDDIGDINSLEFNIIFSKVQVFLSDNLDKFENLVQVAKKIDAIVYPLTREYFLYRYLAKSILVAKTLSLHSYSEAEFNIVKKTHLNFTNYLNSLEQSLTKIEKATNKYNEEHKIASWLTAKSDLVSNHSGKIAATYATLVGGVIALRSYVIDAKDPWYELCALPSTILAMLQILASFPGTVLSNRQTKEINNNMFQELKNSDQNAQDIKFLFDCTPSFANDPINTAASCFRYASNLGLQPIDLLNNDIVNRIILYTALRWSAVAGVVEEQSKVTNFMQTKLIKFLHHEIVPALIENKKFTSKEIKPYFYLLYKHSAQDRNTQIKLQTIYHKLTNEDIDLNNIKLDINTYYGWKSVVMCSAMTTLILDYICFYFRNQELEFYEDPMFYASTSVKFMRLASLLVSTYYGNKLIENITGEKLAHDMFFQKFYYNDAARLTVAIVPLIMFESIKDLKLLSLATLIDVLTTAISDLNVGNAISSAGKNIAEKTATTLTWLNKIASGTNDDTNDDIVIDIAHTEELQPLGCVDISD
ncbi:hypothetical protein [Rickettsia prowazekii]|uniref:hypothetical protein n=1 Tax=Rickettsia prowazekii TaxID=782 RepID=UPI000256C4AA|nr:hypothetical protein [Rickettsia prowazekii]AFE53683.1 hypothetical protein MA7_03315 [Rickettsia prowazekii str. RpGvF24]